MVTRMMTKVKRLMRTPLKMTLLRDVNSLPVHYCHHHHVSTTTTKYWLYQSYKGTSTTYCCSVDDVAKR
jgi:hypothetical protein